MKMKAYTSSCMTMMRSVTVVAELERANLQALKALMQ
jgi:hypothetical protein